MYVLEHSINIEILLVINVAHYIHPGFLKKFKKVKIFVFMILAFQLVQIFILMDDWHKSLLG